MPEILTSYRWRRRLAWTGGFVVVLGGIVVLAFVLPSSHPRQVPSSTATGPSAIDTTQTKQVRVTPAQREAVNRTLVPFVRTGVTRADPQTAWTLVTPAMRAGISRKDWLNGELPVNPFPAKIADAPSWRVLTSYPGDLTVDLVLQPRAGSKVGPIAFAVELKRTRGGRWLVDSMVPEHVFGPSTAAPQTPTATVVTNGKALGPHGRLSPLWFIVPATLLGLVVLVPLAIALNAWRKSRAIERRYRQERGL